MYIYAPESKKEDVKNYCLWAMVNGHGVAWAGIFFDEKKKMENNLEAMDFGLIWLWSLGTTIWEVMDLGNMKSFMNYFSNCFSILI